MPRPIHFEIACDDPDRAAKFYTKVFDWKIDKWDGPIDYWLVTTGSKDEIGIDGGLQRREAPGQTLTNVMGVESVEDVIAKVNSAGGSVIMPKMAVPGVGWTAYFLDTEGNPFGVMQPDEAAK